MSSPRRILEDPTALSDLRSDLQSTVESGTSYDPDAGFARLQSALTSGAASEPPSGTTPPKGADPVTAGAASIGAPAAAKLLLAAAIGGVAALGYAVFAPNEPANPSDKRSHEIAARTAPPPSAAAEPAENGKLIAESPSPASGALASPPATSAGVPQPGTSAEPANTPPVAAASASRREIAQLVRIRALLERDPARAHRAILASSREFPAGVFAEERAGLDAIALFRSGERQRAKVGATEFIARHPNSPLRPRLEQILSGEAP